MQTIKGIGVTDSQAEVYRVLKTHGGRVGLADVALVPLAQHMLNSAQSSSGIRSRRAELVDKGLVQDTRTAIKTRSGRKARVFKAA